MKKWKINQPENNKKQLYEDILIKFQPIKLI